MPFRTYTQRFIPTISYDRLYSTNDFVTKTYSRSLLINHQKTTMIIPDKIIHA